MAVKNRSYHIARNTWIVLAAILVSAPAVQARQTQDKAAFPYIAAIAQDEVYIRSGNADGIYPLGKAKKGELVKVTDEKYGWAQIQTIGPVFERFHGLVKYPQRFANRLKIAADGKSALTLGRVDVIAPNPAVKPGESWKMLVRLNANETIHILRTGKTERGETLHEIRLPTKAKVWIKKQFLRRATAAETEKWNREQAGLNTSKDALARKNPVKNAATLNQPGAKPNAERVLAMDPVATPSVNKPAANTAGEITPAPDTAPREIVMQPGPARAQPQPRAERPRSPRNKSEAERRLEDLEAAFAVLAEEAIESAEIEPLRELYLALAKDHPDHKVVVRYAKARSEQLSIWGELQVRKAEMDKLRARIRMTSAEAEAIRQAMDAEQEYVAIGRLSASVIYDGERLPRLLRLRDPASGRTIAYLQPDENEMNLADMLGHLIGIVGKSAYDGGLRLTLVHPERIDLLAPQQP